MVGSIKRPQLCIASGGGGGGEETRTKKKEKKQGVKKNE